MTIFTGLILFLLGSALGSFINVIALRYDPEKFLFSRLTLGGRSHCSHCKAVLRWFELIPFVSFVIQGARCRRCKAALSWRYPLVELISGIIVLAVWLRVRTFYAPLFYLHHSFAIVTLWVAVFEILFLLSLIDIRFTIIPDEATILIAVLGIALAGITASQFGLDSGSFTNPYALIFGGRDSLLMNRVVGAGVGAVFFGLLIAITRGRGMGMGDLKLAAALGIVFGWPDVFLITIVAFVIGAICGGWALLRRRTTMKSFLPFGPFLTLSSFLVFWGGGSILHFYFSLFPLS